MVRRIGALGLGIGLAAMALALTMLALDQPPARAVGTTHYVSPGAACNGASPCYAGVQAAVDAAVDGDEIRVAAGTYSDIHVRESITQVVYISRSVTIRGGYTPADWTTSNPVAHPTTLDAQGQGRVFYITGLSTRPVIENLIVTNGNATGLGGLSLPSLNDVGGGFMVNVASPTISNVVVFGNTAQGGAGLMLYQSDGLLDALDVQQNTAQHGTSSYGGGIFLYQSPATLIDCLIADNHATATYSEGGGLYLWYSDAYLDGNIISDNSAVQSGGGLYLLHSAAVLIDTRIERNASEYANAGGAYVFGSEISLISNTIAYNTSRYEGGGLLLGYLSKATLTQNVIAHNNAGRDGGAMEIRLSTVTMTNDVLAYNTAGRAGSALVIQGAVARLLHPTVLANSGGDGTGFFVTERNWDDTLFKSDVFLGNSIIATHTVGISVTGGNTTTVEGVLWYNTPLTMTHSITATVSVANEHAGNPALVNPAGLDFHILPHSAARDVGQDVGEHRDMDGQPRPHGLYDLGADEYWPAGTPLQVYMPLVVRE